MKYQVVVGNVGTVYDGDDRNVAEQTYADYVRLSKEPGSRCSGEPVTTFCDGDIYEEFEGKWDIQW